jgi:hypothetical protein
MEGDIIGFVTLFLIFLLFFLLLYRLSFLPLWIKIFAFGGFISFLWKKLSITTV